MKSRLPTPLWPYLSNGGAYLPPGWDIFHEEVVDDERRGEQIQEREAFYQGKRRSAGGDI